MGGNGGRDGKGGRGGKGGSGGRGMLGGPPTGFLNSTSIIFSLDFVSKNMFCVIPGSSSESSAGGEGGGEVGGDDLLAKTDTEGCRTGCLIWTPCICDTFLAIRSSIEQTELLASRCTAELKSSTSRQLAGHKPKMEILVLINYSLIHKMYKCTLCAILLFDSRPLLIVGQTDHKNSFTQMDGNISSHLGLEFIPNSGK
jgi:hypothetical protein